MKSQWKASACLACSLFVLVGRFSALNAAIVYSGNGNTTFGGALGNGSLSLNDDGTTVTGTFTRGSGATELFNDALVIYIDSVSGGFTSTTSFNDQNDGLRRAISGANGSDRSILTFANGFNGDFVVALKATSGENFGGLWGLANGNNNSLNFVDSANLSPINNNASSTYTFSFNWSEIGLTANNSANSFNFQVTYVSNTGYRSEESVGSEGLSGNLGYNDFTFSAYDTFITAVPEPSNYALLIFGVIACATLGVRRWSKLRSRN